MASRATREFCRSLGFEPRKVRERSWQPSHKRSGKPVRGERPLPTKAECWERCVELATDWRDHCANQPDTPSLPEPWWRTP